MKGCCGVCVCLCECVINIVCPSLSHSVHAELKIRNYHVWFSPMVSNWISLAHTLCRQRTDKAIEIDKVRESLEGVSGTCTCRCSCAFLRA